MKKLRKIDVLPSLLTLGNAFCGFLAIAYVADMEYVRAAWMIFLAMGFDALDGKVARLTGSSSDFGAQLDSLSDAITFGVAPAFLVKVLVQAPHSDYVPKVAWGLAVLYVLCAILRLARFNVETDSHEDDAHDSFRGLPSPAAAGTIASLVILYDHLGASTAILNALPVVTVLVGALMVSRFRYVHAFNVITKGGKSFTDLALILFLLVFFALFREVALATLFCGYAIVGPGRAAVLALRADEPELDLVEEEERPSPEVGG